MTPDAGVSILDYMTAASIYTGDTIGIDEAPYGSVAAPLVVINGWSHSTTTDHGTGIQTASVRRYDRDGNIIERHPTLDGATYPAGSDEPRRLAYEAGVLKYHVREVTP